MKIQLFVLSVIILWCSTLCYGAERRKSHGSIPSPSGTYQLSTIINREKTDKRRYLCVVLHLADASGNEISHVQTGVSDRMKWAVGWMKDQDIVIVYSSDVGTLAYAIDAEKHFMPLKPTEEMLKRGEELKQAKYSAGLNRQEIDSCIEALRNSDIKWDGTSIGLWVVPEGEIAKQLLSFGSLPTPALIAALDDPEKFAAAHVLLTLIHKKEFSVSASQWNGLKVELHADGDVVIDPEQIPTIKAMWEKELLKASDNDEGRSQQ